MKNNNLKLTEIEVSISSEEIEAAKKDKAQWDKINKKELKQDDKKEKVEHEKDAVKDDKSKIKKLDKGAPSEKKSIEKKDLKKDVKFDKDSEKEMKADKKPKKSYAQMLTDISAERYGKKKRSELKDGDFLDPKRRSFPVLSARDVKNAVSSWGRYEGSMSFEEFKSKLIKRAKKIGAESALPESWTDKK